MVGEENKTETLKSGALKRNDNKVQHKKYYLSSTTASKKRTGGWRYVNLLLGNININIYIRNILYLIY